ncbi:single-stranded DNA-binding protein [Intrasporangium calvum]|uniref:Single-stranded DNA-binding protein n=1 Tax=Intrasporangium calvum TaxID=53358 RepID=A0ABT5GH76_9MICO|nr:single-stranded DNA-binding protein [Intrasporangium calvum]MDC5697458.1 single-stranded DNA-binding protein [Intrasporangium calvum]
MPRRIETAATVAASPPTRAPSSTRNEVALCGRLSAAAEERVLPSGDALVTLRVIVPRTETRGRRGPDGEKRQGQVDTIDVVCWSARTRRTALRLEPGVTIEVEGSLRRRFFGTPGGRQSRYEVEARTLRRLHGDGRSDT